MPSFPAWLNTVCGVSLIAGALCATVLCADVQRRPQKMAIMNIVWPVCALFGSVLTVWLYWRFGRAAAKGTLHSALAYGTPAHKPPIAVQVATATLHCGSGCTLGTFWRNGLRFTFPASPLPLAGTPCSMRRPMRFGSWISSSPSSLVLPFNISPLRQCANSPPRKALSQP